MASESSFGHVLAEYRKRQGMSRSQLADASGLSYPYVSQLETGIRKPSRKAAAQLAEALGVDPLALEAALPSDDDVNSPSFQRSLAAQAALLAGEGRALPFGATGIEPAPMSPPSASPRSTERTSRDDVVGQLVDLVEELEPGDRLDALTEVQKIVLKRLLEEHSRET